MEYTAQDYQNALEIWFSYRNGDSELSFTGYIEQKRDQLEQPEKLMYKCIKLPPANNGSIKIGNLYSNSYWYAGLCLADLPNHFELVEPEPKPEKITWEEVKALIQDVGVSCGHLAPDSVCSKLKNILRRIKKDHLS